MNTFDTTTSFIQRQRAKIMASFGVNQELLQKSDEQLELELKMGSQTSVQSTVTFSHIASELNQCQLLLEHCHRNTESATRHEALGDAYESFSDLKDQIIESIMGLLGNSYGQLQLSNIPVYQPFMSLEAANRICSVSDVISDFSKINNLPSVDNLSQELCSIGAKLKYKLSLNHNDE